jgi:hypothetical protein
VQRAEAVSGGDAPAGTDDAPQTDVAMTSAEGAGGKKWSARVLLLHGLDAAAREDIVGGVRHGGTPLVNSLRWVALSGY